MPCASVCTGRYDVRCLVPSFISCHHIYFLARLLPGNDMKLAWAPPSYWSTQAPKNLDGHGTFKRITTHLHLLQQRHRAPPFASLLSVSSWNSELISLFSFKCVRYLSPESQWAYSVSRGTPPPGLSWSWARCWIVAEETEYIYDPHHSDTVDDVHCHREVPQYIAVSAEADVGSSLYNIPIYKLI